MNTKSLFIASFTIVFVAVAVGTYFLYPSTKEAAVVAATSAKDATYIIEGQSVTLKNGTSVVPVTPGSASNVTTQYFGNDVSGDFDGDGRMDTAFLLTQNSGGSGTFYYVVAALNMPSGYVGSHALLLGDRIAPQTTGLGASSTVIVNYADRKPGENFTVQPSVGKSLYLKLDLATMQFGEVVQNFEGEANPATMKLNMQTWNWVQTIYSNDTTVSPLVAKKFTLTFKDGKNFSATTDCNGVGGEYAVNGNQIAFSKMLSTLMYCAGSQEQAFTTMLTQVQSYHFTTKGELIFDLKMDSGSMIFR